MDIRVTVKPGSRKGPLVVPVEFGLIVYLHEKAHDGEANNALIKVLAKYYGVSKSQIEIIRGEKSHKKVVNIIGL